MDKTNFLIKDHQSLMAPAYYHREYENDLPKEKMEEESLAKRVTLVALPFIALYTPIGKPLTIALDSMRGITSYMNFSNACSGEDFSLMAKSGLQVVVAVAALGATILAHPLGLLITTGHDIFIGTVDATQHFLTGDYQQSLENLAGVANSSLYLAMIATNSLSLIVLSLAVQISMGACKSISEFQKGRMIEGIGQMLMAGVRTSQLRPQMQQLLLEKQTKTYENLPNVAEEHTIQNKKVILPPNWKKLPPKEITELGLEAIQNGDIATFEQLKNECENWENLKASDLNRMSELVWKNVIHFRQEDEIGVRMLEELIINHPNADRSVDYLFKTMTNAGRFGLLSLVTQLKEKHPSWEALSSDQLLEIFQQTYSPLVLDLPGTPRRDRYPLKRESIISLVMDHPRWDRSSPNLLEKSFSVILDPPFGGSPSVSKEFQEKLLKQLNNYPAWQKLESKHLSSMLVASANRNSSANAIGFSMVVSHEKKDLIDVQSIRIAANRLPYYRSDNLNKLASLLALPNAESLSSSDLSEILCSYIRFGQVEFASVAALVKAKSNWNSMNETEIFNILKAGIGCKIKIDDVCQEIDGHPIFEKALAAKLPELLQLAGSYGNIDAFSAFSEYSQWDDLSSEDLYKIAYSSAADWFLWKKSPFNDVLSHLSQHPNWMHVTEEERAKCIAANEKRQKEADEWRRWDP